MATSPAPKPPSDGYDVLQNVQDEYLATKRAELEANYDRLRESGSIRREADLETLDAVRAESYRKRHALKWSVCADAADALISLAYEVAVQRCVVRLDCIKPRDQQLSACSCLLS